MSGVSATTATQRAVIPAKAGIQVGAHVIAVTELGPGLRRGDEL